MAVTYSTSSTYEVVSKTNLGGGLVATVLAFSFSGTNTTFTFVSPSANVAWCVCTGTPTNIVSGTTPDSFVVNNSADAYGYLTSLSTTTGSLDPVISITRQGSNNQDARVFLLSKG